MGYEGGRCPGLTTRLFPDRMVGALSPLARCQPPGEGTCGLGAGAGRCRHRSPARGWSQGQSREPVVPTVSPVGDGPARARRRLRGTTPCWSSSRTSRLPS